MVSNVWLQVTHHCHAYFSSVFSLVYRDVVKRSWASGSNNADRNAKKKVAYLAIKNAVNVAGGKKRSRQECYYKMIDYKSVLRAKV